jgi:hypothetical protein
MSVKTYDVICDGATVTAKLGKEVFCDGATVTSKLSKKVVA